LSLQTLKCLAARLGGPPGVWTFGLPTLAAARPGLRGFERLINDMEVGTVRP
jgi:hypothetical protein